MKSYIIYNTHNTILADDSIHITRSYRNRYCSVSHSINTLTIKLNLILIRREENPLLISFFKTQMVKIIAKIILFLLFMP